LSGTIGIKVWVYKGDTQLWTKGGRDVNVNAKKI
jgi:ribosomal protein S3